MWIRLVDEAWTLEVKKLLRLLHFLVKFSLHTMFLIFFIWIYNEINKNLCVKAFFINFLLFEAVSCTVEVNGPVHKESCYK